MEPLTSSESRPIKSSMRMASMPRLPAQPAEELEDSEASLAGPGHSLAPALAIVAGGTIGGALTRPVGPGMGSTTAPTAKVTPVSGVTAGGGQTRATPEGNTEEVVDEGHEDVEGEDELVDEGPVIADGAATRTIVADDGEVGGRAGGAFDGRRRGSTKTFWTTGGAPCTSTTPTSPGRGPSGCTAP